VGNSFSTKKKMYVGGTLWTIEIKCYHFKIKEIKCIDKLLKINTAIFHKIKNWPFRFYGDFKQQLKSKS